MSLDGRLRHGLEGLDGLEATPPDIVVDAVLGRGRRSRWTRRLAAAAVALAVAIAGLVLAPKALDALRSAEDRHPATPRGDVGLISTIAGTGTAGTSGDDGPATDAEINAPVDLDFDGGGNLYILEMGYPVRVRKLDVSGRITTVAGPGAPGQAGGLVLGSTFGSTGLAVDVQGDVYIGGGDGPDIANQVIRVEPSGRVTTVAGTGEPGDSGDGGPAVEAQLRNVWDIAIDLQGNLYIAGDNRIRRVDSHGVITTIIGGRSTGFSDDGGPAVDAQTDRVTGVTVDDLGNVYFIDYENGRIRKIDTSGIITTIAGRGEKKGKECFFGEGVPATQAIFCGPEHLDVDSSGNIFVADTYNRRIRRIDTSGIISTIAGDGSQAFTGDGGPATLAGLSKISGVTVGPDGAVYIADSGHNRVRRVAL
jgi:hypothetical protein